MALTKRDPFKDLLFLQERMSRIFDEALLKYKGCSGTGAWFPPVDIYESEDSIVIKAELPGVGMDNVSIEVTGNILTLKGERKPAKNLTEENYHRMERFYGVFQRDFSLPHLIDKGGLTANLSEGVLKIIVPKSPESASGAINIQVQ